MVHNPGQRTSPLYTPKQEAARKQATLERLGRDSDGACRVTSRKDADQESAE